MLDEPVPSSSPVQPHAARQVGSASVRFKVSTDWWIKSTSLMSRDFYSYLGYLIVHVFTPHGCTHLTSFINVQVFTELYISFLRSAHTKWMWKQKRSKNNRKRSKNKRQTSKKIFAFAWSEHCFKLQVLVMVGYPIHLDHMLIQRQLKIFQTQEGLLDWINEVGEYATFNDG